MNTLEDIRKACSEKDWNGYDCEPISELLLKRAEELDKLIPKPEFEVFPCADMSIQWENSKDKDYIVIEVYEDYCTFQRCFSNHPRQYTDTDFEVFKEFLKNEFKDQLNAQV